MFNSFEEWRAFEWKERVDEYNKFIEYEKEEDKYIAKFLAEKRVKDDEKMFPRKISAENEGNNNDGKIYCNYLGILECIEWFTDFYKNGNREHFMKVVKSNNHIAKANIPGYADE